MWYLFFYIAFGLAYAIPEQLKEIKEDGDVWHASDSCCVVGFSILWLPLVLLSYIRVFICFVLEGKD